MTKHIPVLLNETLEMLRLHPGMIVVDATLGGGGYGQAIVSRISPGGTYIGIDRDIESIEKAKKSEWISVAKRYSVKTVLIQRNFGELADIIRGLEYEGVDAIVADLGISSDQLEDVRRGFSFLVDGPLDMRLDRSQKMTAEDIVNTWSEEDIEQMLRKSAGERNSRRIARAIKKMREKKSIETTKELAELIKGAVGRSEYWRKRIHPATKTFMALRMTVNEEMKNLRDFLKASVVLLRSGGRLAVVSFHSGEDVTVKEFLRDQAKGCICPSGFPVCCCGQVPRVKIITRKMIIPKEGEVENNPRSRSARLRVAEKV